jgi:hypothetical protein
MLVVEGISTVLWMTVSVVPCVFHVDVAYDSATPAAAATAVTKADRAAVE